jgi:hypothetical protein
MSKTIPLAALWMARMKISFEYLEIIEERQKRIGKWRLNHDKFLVPFNFFEMFTGDVIEIPINKNVDKLVREEDHEL